MTISNFAPQQSAVSQSLIPRRAALIDALQHAVDKCSARGGVVALVGGSGVGKSAIARQFICENAEAILLDGMADDGKRRPLRDLSGIAVLDEAWQFDGVTNAIRQHVRSNRGAVVVIAPNETEAKELCGESLMSVVQVPHWNKQTAFDDNAKMPNASVDQLQVTPIANHTTKRGVVRFRSPAGDTWTGFGRTPKWLLTLEASGSSREQFQVDRTPLTKKRRR